MLKTVVYQMSLGEEGGVDSLCRHAGCLRSMAPKMAICSTEELYAIFLVSWILFFFYGQVNDLATISSIALPR